MRPGVVREPGLEALGVLGAVAPPGALLGPDDQRHVHSAAQHPADLGGLVADLVHGQHREVDVHVLDDRPETGQGRAQTEPGEPGLGDGGVSHPVRAELVEQTPGDAEHATAAPDADVLAHEHDGGVAAHLLAQGLVQRLGVGEGPWRLAVMRTDPSITVAPSGSGLPSANVHGRRDRVGRLPGPALKSAAEATPWAINKSPVVGDGVEPPPQRGLVLVPVGEGVADVVAKEPVGVADHVGRAVAAPRPLDRLLDPEEHVHDVHAVALDAGDAVGGGPAEEAIFTQRQHLVDRAAHAVQVVLAEEHAGQLSRWRPGWTPRGGCPR